MCVPCFDSQSAGGIWLSWIVALEWGVRIVYLPILPNTQLSNRSKSHIIT